ncbi:uncharacterized protein LOC105681103 [Bombus impatiens]|uniref:Uncharacterized protein LOC105681103 n=1 Tax=Bombus impatiens TaxID=132113 RepID=A0A6P3UYL3_BOMIM|nr:uncharacterized protein LOC105681103 [Bombus impatiens]
MSQNKTNNTTSGNFIRNWLDNKSIHYKTTLYSSELPSYPKGRSYLGICLADARLKFQNLCPNNTLKTLAYDSDHNALIFHVSKNTSDLLTLETQTEIPRYNYKKTDWKKFQNILEQNCDLKICNNVNLTNRQIDAFIDEIEKHTQTALQTALQKSVPNIKQKNSCEPYINNKIKELHRDKSYIISKINNIKLNYSYDKREELEFPKYLLYKIKAQMKQEFANSINHYWTNKIKNISKNDSANMFPQINQIFRPKEQNPIPPLKLPSENASLIQEADNPKQPDPEINYFTNYNQLNTIFSKLNNKKSSGFDGIPNILLKRLPNKIKWYYTVLFNNALNNTYFPRKWKKAKLIAITKKDKDGSSPANLRPISLLPNISKVFEIIINNPLTSFCTKNDIIPENQFGFRHKHSTIHAINKLTSGICWALNAKQRVAACLIDLEKAFDTVWIPGLIYKLIKINLSKHLIKIVWDMITNRTFVMTEGANTSSKEFSITNGLQQAFADDLDDLIIYVTGRKTKTIKTELQELFERINDYYHAWKLKINTSKCETILFRPKLSEIGPTEREHCKEFQVREKSNKGSLIPHKNCVKYLGVNIDYELNYKQHTEIQLTKANKKHSGK